MLNRRELLASLAAIPLLGQGAEDVTQYVNTAIGTGGHGQTYPGATVPFGMVQLGPDTRTEGWDGCSGYHADDSSVLGFSHTHLSGTGIGDMLDFRLMPGTGPSKFSHADEVMSPGYYSVFLRDFGVRAEMTATARAGIHKYTFPANNDSHFVLDIGHCYGKAKVQGNELRAGDTIVGGHSSAGWANGRELYFAMQFSRGYENVNNTLRMPTREGEVVCVKTALSGVSVEGARKNLAAEIPGWDFDDVRRRAQAAWQRVLGKVRIASPDTRKKTIFYTSLYHTMLAPTLFDDVDGQYRGMDGKVHPLAPGAHNYSTFSLWDTYRAAHPLYTLIQPERVPGFVNCLVRMAHESPAGLPVWPLQAKETGCMTGFHSVVVMAEAAAKGFSGIDYAAAYTAVRKRVMDDDYRGMNHYREFGYLPCDLDDESVSKTLGYAYDDWAAAHVAQAAGAMSDYALLRKRSKNYRELFDKQNQFMRPRLKNGDWAEPFNPKEIQISKRWKDFTESNAWQETFANQHDVKGYMQLFGGREAFVKKLDALFNQSTDLPPDTPPDVAGLVGMYAHGNEPSHHVAYLYCYAGAPWKTQARVRSLLETMYRDEPDGMAGNEDCGAMSAWYVMSALGFYAVDPVSGNYVFGSPLFDRAIVELAPGKHLLIEAKGAGAGHCYVQSIRLNGKPYTKTWFHHADIAAGGSLEFEMGSAPNEKFGAHETDAPPSLTA
jgi:predicted alpha-1,2-mannosidase